MGVCEAVLIWIVHFLDQSTYGVYGVFLSQPSLTVVRKPRKLIFVDLWVVKHLQEGGMG